MNHLHSTGSLATVASDTSGNGTWTLGPNFKYKPIVMDEGINSGADITVVTGI